jgi:hypothetical protein
MVILPFSLPFRKKNLLQPGCKCASLQARPDACRVGVSKSQSSSVAHILSKPSRAEQAEHKELEPASFFRAATS